MFNEGDTYIKTVKRWTRTRDILGMIFNLEYENCIEMKNKLMGLYITNNGFILKWKISTEEERHELEELFEWIFTINAI